MSAPYFEDLPVGRRFEDAPSLTLTDGHAAVHQAIVGDRLRVVLDRALSDAVLGPGAPLAHPALVWDTAIGQSSAATGRVIANLFYRGLLLHRPVRIGDTLRTVTEVVARRENRVREGRPPTGLVVLRIRTVDQEDRPVLDFTRCPMIPLRGEPTGEAGDEVGGAADLEDDALRGAAAGFDLSALPSAGEVEEGDLEGGDVVDSAPALARMTLNVAMAHFDATRAAHGQRLVYGGHTIALAADQAARAAPGLVTILGWHSADHTGPVFEGDTLRSRIEVERRDGELVHLRSHVTAVERDEHVLDWRFVGVLP
jgi:acyl dehydratase